MLEVAADIADAARAGRAVAVATVIGIEGSAPRAVGASMMVDESGAVIGSVSGGCVEGAVVEVCRAVLDGAHPTVVRFGISDESAMQIGLTCGGDLDVFVQRLDPGAAGAPQEQASSARAGRTAGLATIVSGPADLLGSSIGLVSTREDLTDSRLLAAGLEELTVARLRAELDAWVRAGRSGVWIVDCGSTQLGIFFEVSLPPARLLIFGAVDFSAALADAAKLLGYRVTVCDARALFTTPERFPSADEVVVKWPHRYLAATEVDERTVVCVLTHDEKFDIPLLQLALSLPVAYVGAMGSRRTHERRMRLLVEAGVPAEHLTALHSPIGLDLGASSPAETAISILAEVIAARTQASGSPLTVTSGPIHRAGHLSRNY
ncbi:XdhC family protein [Psychromicrobium xiongbiense]|uniref:XdhC family protein n=1 Tax=Psychromicrobium xiongbiense TaxID=3051184 RepID=UPI00255707AF|nr:XdhC/CoxI family protein [Psychromicrobium sp. YIM S02556]